MVIERLVLNSFKIFRFAMDRYIEYLVKDDKENTIQRIRKISLSCGHGPNDFLLTKIRLFFLLLAILSSFTNVVKIALLARHTSFKQNVPYYILVNKKPILY